MVFKVGDKVLYLPYNTNISDFSAGVGTIKSIRWFNSRRFYMVKYPHHGRFILKEFESPGEDLKHASGILHLKRRHNL